MKKIMLLLFSALLSLTIFAQTPGVAEKNAGNAAWKAKNYAEAFKNFEAYLKAVDFKDNAYLYNAATAASKAKLYADAVKYYDMAIQAKYKIASSYQGKAVALREQNKTKEMLATLQEGIKAVSAPNNQKLENMYATYYMKEGQKFQKAGNEAKAAEAYRTITDMNNKSFKVQGFLSLGTLYFNSGAKILQEVNPLANTDKAKYEEGKVKAMDKFKQAKSYVVKAQGIEPAHPDVKDLLSQLNEAMK
ncbi:MAG: hypothetical protein K2I90_10665 [Odoribacter sp.]|nr:hypothetical protein [Odoribacter sp.]